MAQASMPEYASAVPLNDIDSARTREHQNWQLNFRSAFMLTCNDTFRYRLVEEDDDAAYDARVRVCEIEPRR